MISFLPQRRRERKERQKEIGFPLRALCVFAVGIGLFFLGGCAAPAVLAINAASFALQSANVAHHWNDNVGAGFKPARTADDIKDEEKKTVGAGFKPAEVEKETK